MISLSPRLQSIVALLEPTEVLADIGTDHGMIPAWVVRNQIAKRAYACDLRQAPLEGARRLLAREQLLETVTLLQGDGLGVLEDRRVDAVVIAGMGGPQICRLLSRAPEVIQRVQQLVVQPNRGAHLVRALARSSGFHLEGESILGEKGRHFITCRFFRRDGEDPIYRTPDLSAEDALRWGPHLIRRRDPTALEYFRLQRERLQICATQNAKRYRLELERLERVLDCFSPSPRVE